MSDHYYEGQVQYIGPRFVPRFATPIEWNKEKQYEQLEMVVYLGNTYTSRKPVPAGIEITNDDYWALTGNYNYQVEAYRQEVERYKGDIIDQFNNTTADIDAKIKYTLNTAPSATNAYYDIFINAQKGNDDTGDGTRNNPFKTLKKASELGNKYNLPVYRFISQGTYEASNDIAFKSNYICFKADVAGNVTLILDSLIKAKFIDILGYDNENYMTIDSTLDNAIKFQSAMGHVNQINFEHEISFEYSLIYMRNTNTKGLTIYGSTKMACSNVNFNAVDRIDSSIITQKYLPNVVVFAGSELTVYYSGIKKDKPFSEPSNIMCDLPKAVFALSESTLKLLIQEDDISESLTTKYDYLIWSDMSIVASTLTTSQISNVATNEIKIENNKKYKWLGIETE